SPSVSIWISNSLTDWVAAWPHVLIRNTRPRSVAVECASVPGSTFTPTSRTSFGCPRCRGLLMPHAYRSAVPAWMPLLVTENDAESVLPGVPVPVEEVEDLLVNALRFRPAHSTVRGGRT